MQICYLREECEAKKNKLNNDRKKEEAIKTRIVQRNETIKLYISKILKIKMALRELEKHANNTIKEQKTLSEEIIKLEKSRVKQLDKAIYNITEIKPKL